MSLIILLSAGKEIISPFEGTWQVWEGTALHRKSTTVPCVPGLASSYLSPKTWSLATRTPEGYTSLVYCTGRSQCTDCLARSGKG